MRAMAATARHWIWERPDWPQWEYTLRPHTIRALHAIRTRRGAIADMAAEHPHLQARAIRATLATEARATSELEGEFIPREDLRMIAEGHGVPHGADPRAAGVVRMLRICRDSAALRRDTLLAMHAALFDHLRTAATGAPPWVGNYLAVQEKCGR